MNHSLDFQNNNSSCPLAYDHEMNKSDQVIKASSPFASDNLLFSEYCSTEEDSSSSDDKDDGSICERLKISSLLNTNILKARKLNILTDNEIMESLNQVVNNKEVSRESEKKSYQEAQLQLNKLNIDRKAYFERNIGNPDVEISPIVSIMEDNLTEYERAKLPAQGNGSGSNCHRCRKRYELKKKGFTRYIYYCKTPFNLQPDDKANCVCRKKFCDRCLLKLFDEQPCRNILEQDFYTWKCPACRLICLCKECIERKDLGIPFEPRKKIPKLAALITSGPKKKRGRPFGLTKENLENKKEELMSIVKDLTAIKTSDTDNILLSETDFGIFLSSVPTAIELPLIPIDLTLKDFNATFQDGKFAENMINSWQSFNNNDYSESI